MVWRREGLDPPRADWPPLPLDVDLLVVASRLGKTRSLELSRRVQASLTLARQPKDFSLASRRVLPLRSVREVKLTREGSGTRLQLVER